MFLFIRMVSFRPYSIVWICVCHKKITHLDTFLNELCSRFRMVSSQNPENKRDIFVVLFMTFWWTTRGNFFTCSGYFFVSRGCYSSFRYKVASMTCTKSCHSGLQDFDFNFHELKKNYWFLLSCSDRSDDTWCFFKPLFYGKD